MNDRAIGRIGRLLAHRFVLSCSKETTLILNASAALLSSKLVAGFVFGPVIFATFSHAVRALYVSLYATIVDPGVIFVHCELCFQRNNHGLMVWCETRNLAMSLI